MNKEIANSQEYKDILEVRAKKVSIIKEIETVKSQKIKDQLVIKEQQLKNERLQIDNDKATEPTHGWSTPIGQLIDAAKAWCIDNDKTVVGSEPFIRSLWNDEELEMIKKKIMAKLKAL
jgi:hypothetical protein